MRSSGPVCDGQWYSAGVRYRFGEFVLDARAYTLVRGAEEVSLQPKVFDVLRHLLEHRDRVVTKQELLDALWVGEHVNEGAVPWSISHARRALGQERGAKAPIETVHGRGYRFTSPVELLPQSTRPPEPLRSSPPPAPQPQPMPSSASGIAYAPPFVGRAEVMQRLEQRLERAAAGEGGLCLLVGEAGMGKTRCADELAERARQRGMGVWSGRTVEGLGAPVLWPWLSVLRDAVRSRPALREPGEALLSKLAALAQTSTANDESGSAQVDGSGRFWMLDGVSRFLLDAAEQAPVVVLIDDLHWADAGTLDLLSFLAPELRRAPLLVLATLREERAANERKGLGRVLRAAERIELKHLSLADVERYMTALAEGSTPPVELCRAVHRASAGNPLFVQETVRALLSEHAGETLSEIAAEEVQPSRLARDVLRARLRPFDADELRVLSRASVLGDSFEVTVLQRLAPIPLEQLLTALEHAEEEGLVVPEGEGSSRFRFAHALIRGLLYDDLPSGERVVLHRRAAEVLSELYRAEPRHSEIAFHYHRSLPAGEYDRVADAARRAAEAASRVQAFEDAASFYDWALEAQALDPQVTPRARAELLMAQSTAQRLAGRDEAARRSNVLVIDLARQHGFADLLLAAARARRPTQAMSAVPDPLVRDALEEILKIAPQGPDPIRIGALSLLSCVPPYAYDMRRSGELSAEALALARRSSHPGSLFEALRARLHSLSGPDDVDGLLEVAAEMLERSDGRSWVAVEAHGARFGALVLRGDLPAADAALRELGRVANTRRWPEVIWYHDRLQAQRRLLDGDFAVAEAAGEELRARSKRMGLSYGPAFIDSLRNVLSFMRLGPERASATWPISLKAMFAASGGLQPSYRAALVRLATDVGQIELGRRMFEDVAARDFEDVPKDIAYPNALHSLGISAARLGDRPRAERLYALLRPYAAFNTPNNMLFYEGSASYALGLMAAALGMQAEAEQHFEDALAMNERIGTRPHLARTYAAYAQHWAGREGKAAQARARELAAKGRELAEALGMAGLIGQLDALRTP